MIAPASPLTVCSCPASPAETWDESVVAQDASDLGPSRLSWGSLEESVEHSSPGRPTTAEPSAEPAPVGEVSVWKLDDDGGEESARRWMEQLPAEQRGWVSHLPHESGLRHMQEVLTLRAPPVFTRTGEGIELGPGTSREATQTSDVTGGRCVATEVVMRSGQHRGKYHKQAGSCLRFLGRF